MLEGVSGERNGSISQSCVAVARWLISHSLLLAIQGREAVSCFDRSHTYSMGLIYSVQWVLCEGLMFQGLTADTN